MQRVCQKQNRVLSVSLWANNSFAMHWRFESGGEVRTVFQIVRSTTVYITMGIIIRYLIHILRQLVVRVHAWRVVRWDSRFFHTVWRWRRMSAITALSGRSGDRWARPHSHWRWLWCWHRDWTRPTGHHCRQLVQQCMTWWLTQWRTGTRGERRHYWRLEHCCDQKHRSRKECTNRLDLYTIPGLVTHSCRAFWSRRTCRGLLAIPTRAMISRNSSSPASQSCWTSSPPNR